jgi:hypothetical protein
MQNQKAHKLRRDGAFRNILYSPTIDEYQANVKQINRSSTNFLNQDNTALATSFIENGQPEEAVKMLVAIGLDELLASFLVSVGGMR